ncbi:MAG: alpha/beta fold hydrolase [Ilumatobacteraceae bacterium]
MRLTTSDGHALDADLVVPEHPMAAAVICHPHPQFGGNRHDHVVSRLFEVLPRHGCAALRFDFRREYGGGIDERLDVVAALDALAAAVPGVPTHLVGYSFGAIVALGTLDDGTGDDRITGRVLVAPPLGAGLPEVTPARGPILVITPEHDQFCPPAAAAEATASWPDTRLETIPMADHFLAGRADVVAALTATYLTEPSA